MRSQASLRDRPRNVGVADSSGIPSPYFSVDPSVNLTPQVGGSVFTFALGTEEGDPAPDVTYELFRDGVDVTANMVGLDYTSPAGAATLKFIVYAKNPYGVERFVVNAATT